MTLHSALIPQLHGSMQRVLWQALSRGHSSSDWHPTGTGSAVMRNTKGLKTEMLAAWGNVLLYLCAADDITQKPY